MMAKRYILVLFILFSTSLVAQETFPVNGTKDEIHNYYAFTNAVIFLDYQTRVEQATLLIKDGKVVSVGADISIPKGAVIYDLKGKYIYPSLIDAYSDYGMPAVKKPGARGRSRQPQFLSNKKGPFSWNQAIKPETKASAMFGVDKKKAGELREMGFGAVLTHQHDGIARGTSAFVTLAEAEENKVTLASEAAAQYSFQKGSSTQNYPTSLMGAIALMRQTYLDAQWYSSGANQLENNLSLEAINLQQNLPQIIEVRDYLTALRADTLGDEFGVQYIIKGNGDEYKRLINIKATNASFIIPLNFPKPFDVEDPYDAVFVSLEQMKHWELAPANPAIMGKFDIPFAFTLSGIKGSKSFWKNLRKAIEHGLTESGALKALTFTPAGYIGMEDKIGALKEGMIANFIISEGNLFHEGNTIYENWVQGKQYLINDLNLVDVRGDYDLNIDTKVYGLKISGEIEKLKGQVIAGEAKIKANITQNGKIISLSFEADDERYKGIIRLSGKVNFKSSSWDGKGQLPEGTWVDWNAVRKKEFSKKAKDTAQADTIKSGQLYYPNMAYGFKELPTAEDLLIKNATVWTNDTLGILKTNVLIRDGKIAAVGRDFEIPEGIKVIDAAGKHLSPGIIDEHTHIAISRGVNESAQAVSAEVRIADVVNSDDINIYRALAGGVTAAQLLHGSANPVGGQLQVIKLRWGLSPEEMKIKGADGFIKFALGENVKQSNWGDHQTIRFPQTRMGVEQVFYDAFIRAKEYDLNWRVYHSLKKKEKAKTPSPRKDLELDALSEILHRKRFITCHSYQQSEINMLIRVADSMGFIVNTFTHILEGYKVADKMKAHGAGGSSFSDWWAYKFEVNDAIPYNGALMHRQGVITAYNSDDAEMGRRLNQEAAKAVKYGGVSEEEALKFVTLNPAKLLHLDHRMGSIAVGKDADLVIWSDNPLSVYAKAEKTFIDGICYYDIERDKAIREEIRIERARLTEKMLKAKKSGEATRKTEWLKDNPYQCNTIEDEKRVAQDFYQLEK